MPTKRPRFIARPGQLRVLVFDIETSPLLAHVWGLWNNNVGLNQIQSDWYVLSWSAKWLGEKEVMYRDQRDATDIENDRDILLEMANLLDQADVVVAHNGKKFDVKKLNARFILNGIQPPSPYRIIDTLEAVKRVAKFSSNRLEYLTNKLNTRYKKLKHAKFPGHELWKAVMRGDLAGWKEMERYNRHDVLSLEEFYLKLRPWIIDHPNLDVSTEEEGHACPVCGGDHLERRGFQYTQSGKYQRFKCVGCGAWSRSRYTLQTKDKRKGLLVK